MAGVNWEEVATLLNLRYYPNYRGPFGRKGFVTGDLEGQLVTISPANAQRSSAVGILVHSPPIPDAAGLRAALETDLQVCQALLGKEARKAKMGSMLSIGREGVALVWPIGLRPPSAEKIATLARAVAAVVTRTVGELGQSCHRCGRSDAPIMLVNNTPLHLCNGCAETLRFAGSEAARAYAQKSPNLLLGLLFGLGAGLAGAVAWAIVAFATQRISLLLAIGIGLLVGWATHRGMGKFTWVGQVAAVLITLGSVLVGELVYVALLLVQEGVDFFSALLAVLLSMGIIFGESDTWVSLFFGLIGALYILYRYRPPRVGITVEPLESAPPAP
ncbi:MAG: hypothetical protein ACK4WK_08115 [Anaerolineae bacterium]